MRKKVLYYSIVPNDTTAFWRSSGVFPYINSPEFELIDISEIKNFSWDVFTGVSIFIFQRPFSSEHASLIVLAKDMGVKIILDYDDNLFAVDSYNPTYGMYQNNQKSLFDCIRIADELWVSTKSIADEYKHPNTWVIPNSHNDYMFPVKDKKAFNPKGKTAIWRGGSSHRADIYENGDKLIETINNNKDWNFKFIGDRFEYIEQRTGDNHHIVGGQTIFQYFKWLNFENPQILFFPLCNTKFNQGKSNISWIEVTYAGGVLFGNMKLPEFNLNSIQPIEALWEGDDFLHWEMINEVLYQYNQDSWKYIKDNLLLSNVNVKRISRILSNL